MHKRIDRSISYDDDDHHHYRYRYLFRHYLILFWYIFVKVSGFCIFLYRCKQNVRYSVYLWLMLWMFSQSFKGIHFSNYHEVVNYILDIDNIRWYNYRKEYLKEYLNAEKLVNIATKLHDRTTESSDIFRS